MLVDLRPGFEERGEEPFGFCERGVRLLDIGFTEPAVDVDVEFCETGGDFSAGVFVETDGELLDDGASFCDRGGTLADLPLGESSAGEADGLDGTAVEGSDKFQGAGAEDIPILLDFVCLDRHSLCFRGHLLHSSEKGGEA